MALYKEILLDHYQNPRCHGELVQPTFVATESNPLCGDLVKMTGLVVGGRLQAIGFIGHGCVISQGVASMVAEKWQNFLVSEILDLSATDILQLIQMELGPNRLKCAILPLLALQKGLRREG